MKIKYPVKHPHAMSAAAILHAFQTDAAAGISKTEVEKRTKRFGPNLYKAQKPKSVWLILLQQFTSPIVYLLIFGAAVSFWFRDITEGIAILAVIFINALIGFWMELQARSSMNALKEMDIILSKVIRDGATAAIPSESLTVGDIVLLEAGDLVPGDGRLLELNQLKCDESSLTGESLPAEKNIANLPLKTEIAEQTNMVFKGTSVINGNGKAVITGIAQNTQLGIIAALVEGAEETITPLDKKLNALSKKLIWLTLILTFIFAVLGVIEGKEWTVIIKTSIALAVAAFPEGLPIVATVALSYGMLRMAKRKVIIKKLSAVETLGSTNVILTDKTGTLTENKIYVDTLSFPEEILKVHIEKRSLLIVEGKMEKSAENFKKLKLIGALCNNTTEKSLKGKITLVGDPIEIALAFLADTSSSSADNPDVHYERIAEIPFSSEAKIMGTLHKGAHGYLITAKGAVEQLIEKCSQIQYGKSNKDFNENEKKTVLAASENMAAEGLRVLAFAYRTAAAGKDDFLNQLVYVGMIGFLDPPRLDIKKSILSCKNAGIQIVMITGDHPLTALNIAKKVGLVAEDEQNVITGSDLPPMKSLTDKWRKKMLSTAVFARTTPQQKLEIATVFQKAGNIVAMTGDGVNDAPALKKADVGIAMGLRGTQVAKETASVVVKDDSFNSIVRAVAQGRVIFQNIQKFVIYLVSCNLSEIFIVTILGFFAPAAILLPLQILFLNMVTDVLPALALGLGKGDKGVMEQPPKNPKDKIVSNHDWRQIVFYAAALTIAVMAAVVYCQQFITTDSRVINNLAFSTLVFAQLLHVFNMSSSSSGFWINDITRNKYVWLALLICIGALVLVYIQPQLRAVLHLTVLSARIWLVSIWASLIPLGLVQAFTNIWKK